MELHHKPEGSKSCERVTNFKSPPERDDLGLERLVGSQGLNPRWALLPGGVSTCHHGGSLEVGKRRMI